MGFDGIPPDGHCLYRSIEDQLQWVGWGGISLRVVEVERWVAVGEMGCGAGQGGVAHGGEVFSMRGTLPAGMHSQQFGDATLLHS